MSSTGVERRYANNSGHWQNSVCISYASGRDKKENTMKGRDMIRGILTPAMMVLFVGISSHADAAVLCANPSGSVFVREVCKKNEVQLDPVALGAASQQQVTDLQGQIDALQTQIIAAQNTITILQTALANEVTARQAGDNLNVARKSRQTANALKI